MSQIYSKYLREHIDAILVVLGGIASLIYRSIKEVWEGKIYWNLVREQIYFSGFKSGSLVLVTALSTGMVMALQFGLGLQKFGGKLYVPKIVSLSFVRELGPVFTCLVVAGRVGAGMASEIGSMMVTQQIDAIRALGSSPIQRIVVPRMLGLFIALPLLTAAATAVGIWGSMLIGDWELALDPGFYYAKAVEILKISDFFMGVGKTFFFAILISGTACYYGLNVKEGTKGVGIATTQAVVTSSILLFVFNVLLTKFFWIFIK